MGKEFGRRSLEAQMRADAFAELGAGQERASRAAAPSNDGGGLAILAVQCVVVMVVGGGIGWYLTHLSSNAPTAAQPVPVVAAAPPPTRTEAALASIQKSCEGVKHNVALMDDYEARNGIGVGGMRLPAAENEVLLTAAYANCLMNQQPRRFCQKEDKADMIGAVSEYLTAIRIARLASGFANKIVSNGMEKSSNKAAREAYQKLALENQGKLHTSAPSDNFDERLVVNLRGLVAVGLTKASDFVGTWSGTVPDEITAMLKDVRISKQECVA